MARVSYVEETDHPELAGTIGKIKSGRGGVLLNIYKLLLHSPKLALTWLDHVSTVRFATAIPGRIRELITIRMAHLNRIEYVLQQHVPNLALAEGVTLEECNALADWRASGHFSERERAVLAYADAMLAGPHLANDVFAAVRRHFDERQVVELTVLIGTYIMHNRVFNALKVDLEPS